MGAFGLGFRPLGPTWQRIIMVIVMVMVADDDDDDDDDEDDMNDG